ncbi:MAG: hypothetical protein QG656_2713, partial [Candidatus Hydrogenedentes bacterium]|nr:hypothetical protein [Candidatus Hydrogenedentota bacterium]
MPLTACRECGNEVSTDARHCPHCGAPFPSRAEWTGWGYEWKSKTSVAGWPLVHIAFGRNAQGRLRVARGIFAVGQFAIGMVTIAQFGVGALFGLGQFMVGLTAVAQFALSAYFALGQIAVGGIAIGQVVVARYGLGQGGFAQYLWSAAQKD